METVKASFDWKINNFTKIYKNIDYIQLSKTFCNPDFPLVEWQLFLEMVKNGTYVTVWLRQIGPNSKNELTSTKYKIWSEHEDFKIVISKSSYKFEHQDKLGLAEVPTEALRVNGHLLLKCEVVVERYSLLENLQNNYKKMLDSGSFADFKFKVGTEEMVAHRCVLSQNSDVFKTMFDQSGMTEAQQNSVDITDTTPECFRAMLEFCYTSRIAKEVMIRHVEGIYAIAHKYRIKLLQYECERFMASNIDIGNVMSYCEIVKLYDIPLLKEATMKYIQLNNEELNLKLGTEEKDKLALQLGHWMLSLKRQISDDI